MVKVKENDRQRHVVFSVSYRLRNTACTAKDTTAVALRKDSVFIFTPPI